MSNTQAAYTQNGKIALAGDAVTINLKVVKVYKDQHENGLIDFFADLTLTDGHAGASTGRTAFLNKVPTSILVK